jgi:DMSO/TMAO reductase YedYZ molybdopterin-dependent catalytic subunit
MLQMQTPRTQPMNSTARRVLILAAAIGVVAAVKRAYDTWFRPSGKIEQGTGTFPDLTGLSKEITPADEFYTVSKNSVDPVVREAVWKLEIGGEVKNPGSFTMEELRKMRVLSMYATLSCISNEVGGNWTGNARWTGVPLRDLIEAAGPISSVHDVVLYAEDSYSDSISLAKAMDPLCVLAYDMNNEPLTTAHGYPLRLVVPGIYGMKNVKWIRKIELRKDDYRGFWQKRGWDDDAPYKLMSRIDVARNGVVAGIAFGGDRGVSAVEVKIGDQPWRQAELREALSPLSWVLWHLEADVKGKPVIVRMFDSEGQMQTGQPRPPFPDGASGYHTVIGE